MTRLQIKIKDADKAIIVLNLLKELPFVEIEKSEDENNQKRVKIGLTDLFGVWEDREISLVDIRKKAWMRNHGTM
jgi:predicted nucleic acid-binding protein